MSNTTPTTSTTTTNTGTRIAAKISSTEVPSSAAEIAGAAKPKVAAFSTMRVSALNPWVISAITMPMTRGLMKLLSSSEDGLLTAGVCIPTPALNTTPPAAGRITVETRSFTVSTAGILSATNSKISSPPNKTRAQGSVSQLHASGRVMKLVHFPSAPMITNGM